jgi:hypothetical protein
LICPTTFLAIVYAFCTWQELELDRRLPAEDGDHHLERAAVDVDVVDHAGEVVERAVDDLDHLALLEHVLRLRLLLGGHHLLDDLVDLALRERRGLRPVPTKPVTLGVFFTTCHDSSDISISTRM